MALNLVFVGTYTDPSAQAGFEVSAERSVMGMTGPTGSEGIYVYRHDPAAGTLDLVHTAASVNPSFLALDPQERFLFAVNEVREFGGELSGAVSSFAIDQETGELRFISQVPTGGGNPCHLSLSPSGRHLFVANHEAGNVAVFPVDASGALSPATDLRTDEPVDDRRSHAHYVTPDPGGNFVLTSNTGTDRVMVYRFDEGEGKLVPNDPPWGETHKGGSPRHLAFTPDGAYLFANGEADLTLSVFRFDPEGGALRHVHQASTVEPGEAGQRRSTAQMQVHPSGRFAYVANRGEDTIAVFRFDREQESIARIANEPTRGRTPRNFTIDPTGRRLYAANQNSDTIEAFTIDGESGLLTHTGQVAHVPAPTCVLFTTT